MPEFRCDLAQTGIPLKPVWAHTVGSGHAPLALHADWQAQLRRCREDLGIRHVRFHGGFGLLTNHAMPGYAMEAERVRLVLHGAFEPSEAVVEHIDEDHANARKL